MADAEKKIIIDLDIKTEDIQAATSAMAEAKKKSVEYQQELTALKTEQKELNALYKVGAIDSAEYAKKQIDLKTKTAEASKGVRESNKAYQQNKTVIDAANGSNDQLRSRLGILTKKYNGLSKEQRENTKEGQKMGATIKALTDKLKKNEKAVGDNRRNVGNYSEAIENAMGNINIMGVNVGGLVTKLKAQRAALVAGRKAQIASTASVGLGSTALNIFKIALASTGIGLLVIALGSLVAYFTSTKRGVELADQAFAGIKATIAVVVDRLSSLTKAFTLLKDGKFSEAADSIKESFSGIGDEIANDAKEAAGLEKQMQKLRDAERDLTVDISKRKAEVAALQLIAEDETKTFQERGEAIKKANEIQAEAMQRELDLQRERVRITEEQLELGENLEVDENKLAEERARLGEIEAASLKKLRSLKAKENSIVNQERAATTKHAADVVAQAKEANKLKIDNLQKEKELSEKASAELIKRWQDERTMIDDLASLEKDKATISIESAEQRAEKIAYIEREALLEKIRNIDNETVAYTAAAGMIGEVDEVKYAKQLAERTKYEVELAEIDRAARSQKFTDKIAALALDEQLENDAAELSIDNTEKLEQEKGRIALRFLGAKLDLMTKLAEADGILTDKELKNLQLVENKIAKIKGSLANEEENPTLADMIGLSDDDIADIQLGLAVVSGLLGSIQSAISANASNRMTEIDNQSQAEISAIENSTASEEEKDKKIKSINKKAAQEKYKIELEQFKVSKALSVALAIANTATAVMAQLSNPTPYVGFVLAALAAVTGGIQIGIASSTEPPPPPRFAKGGVLQGATHADGGIQLYGKNGNHYGEAEGDEIIMTKGVWRNPILRQRANDLNVMGGGSPLTKGGTFMAAGGVTGSSYSATGSGGQSLTKGDIASAMAEAVANQPAPVVSVTEIENVSAQKSKVQVESDL